ncbi:MAG: response regulator transcription factor [Terriglobales bacterium]
MDQRIAIPRTEKRTVFVVEDDADIARLICIHLEGSGYEPRWFSTSYLVIEEAVKAPPSLFLLDIMIPGSDGIELCRQIRGNEVLATTHIIFLTARSGETDRVIGLELGGDDYITKPFSPRELIARVDAVHRRAAEPIRPNVIKLGQIEIDAVSMILTVNGNVVPATSREFYLLNYLVRHVGRVFTRDQLLDAVWSKSRFVTVRSVDVYIRRLREKIETEPEHPRYIMTVRGVGYRFDSRGDRHNPKAS